MQTKSATHSHYSQNMYIEGLVCLVLCACSDRIKITLGSLHPVKVSHPRGIRESCDHATLMCVTFQLQYWHGDLRVKAVMMCYD